jgi:hypothetical protein
MVNYREDNCLLGCEKRIVWYMLMDVSEEHAAFRVVAKSSDFKTFESRKPEYSFSCTSSRSAGTTGSVPS